MGAGIAFFAPLLEGLVRDARGEELKTRRFVWYGTGNGIAPERFMPSRVASPTDFDLPASYAPLEPLKQDVLLLERFYVPQTPQLHGSGFSAATNTASLGGEEEDALPGGISFDRALARELGQNDRFSSINLAFFHKELYGSNNFSRIYVPHMSGDGPGQVNPPEWSPLLAFDRYFGQAVMGPDPSALAELRSQLGKSVLDRVVGDIQAMQARLAGTERAKLEQYLESIRTLEKQVTASASAGIACQMPTAPMAGAGTPPDRVLTDWVHAFVDLIAQAFVCGVTHVAALSLMGRAGPDKPFEALGADNIHALSHDGNHARLTLLEQFEASIIVRLFDKLRSVQEGAGTAADNTMLLWVNACGGNHHNGHNSHPVVIVGSGGGYFETGRYLSYPEGQQPLGKVLVSIAQALGTNLTTFGDAEFGSEELPGLI